MQAFRHARIYILDDSRENGRWIQHCLESYEFHRIRLCQREKELTEALEESEPDLLILDVHLTERSGLEILRDLNNSKAARAVPLPVLIITGDDDPDIRRQALALGAMDFLTKDMEAMELALRCKNLLTMRSINQRLHEENETLSALAEQRQVQLGDAYLDSVRLLAHAAEYRDDATGLHIARVGRTSALLARQIGLPDEKVLALGHAAQLHDIGKIAVPDNLLLKPGRLTPPEYEVIKMHTLRGAEILGDSPSPLIQMARQIALTHHERWDGKGYPYGLGEDDIPIEGRIVAVADVLDALIHERPYKPAWPLERALGEIHQQAGKQFDPIVVQALQEILEPDMPERETSASSAAN